MAYFKEILQNILQFESKSATILTGYFLLFASHICVQITPLRLPTFYFKGVFMWNEKKADRTEKYLQGI